MNLFYEDYPETIVVDGQEIRIRTDFREYIRLIDLLRSDELRDSEKWPFILQYFYDYPNNISGALDALVEFINLDNLFPERTIEDDAVQDDSEEYEFEEETYQKPLYSFQYDYPYILAGFLCSYGINLRTVPYMHWWEFRLLFDGLPEDTEIKKMIMYRGINPSTIKDNEERKRIIKIQNAIRLPEEVAMSDYDIGDAFA